MLWQIQELFLEDLLEDYIPQLYYLEFFDFW